MSAAEAALFGEQQTDTFDARHSMWIRRCRDATASSARARRSPRAARTRSPSSTCACHPGGTGWRPSSTSGRSTQTYKSWSAPPTPTTTGWSSWRASGTPTSSSSSRSPSSRSRSSSARARLSRKWQNARALKRHVESLERVVTDRTSGLEAANRQLRHLASHDALTGLPNRMLLDDRITQAIAQADRQSHEFAVLVIDLDRFKLINDSLGHRAGDELLREVAQRLKSAVRAVDTTARLGGDEFVILLDGPMTQAEAVEIGTRAIQGDGAVHATARHRRAHLPEHRHRVLPAGRGDRGHAAGATPTPPCTAPRSAAATTCSAMPRA